MTKAEQRAYIHQQKKLFLQSTTMAEREAISEQIFQQVEQLDEFKKAHVVMAYYSLPDEVMTHQFIDRWAESKTILLPKVDGNDLTLHRYEGKQSIIKGTYGIGEPNTPRFVDYQKIDLVIVPGVAFDDKGRRLGRGRGYYDRFFLKLNLEHTTLVGVCYPFQKLLEVVTDIYDIKTDMVIC